MNWRELTSLVAVGVFAVFGAATMESDEDKDKARVEIEGYRAAMVAVAEAYVAASPGAVTPVLCSDKVLREHLKSASDADRPDIGFEPAVCLRSYQGHAPDPTEDKSLAGLFVGCYDGILTEFEQLEGPAGVGNYGNIAGAARRLLTRDPLLGLVYPDPDADNRAPSSHDVERGFKRSTVSNPGGRFHGSVLVVDRGDASPVCVAPLRVDSSVQVEYKHRGMLSKSASEAVEDDFRDRYEAAVELAVHGTPPPGG